MFFLPLYRNDCLVDSEQFLHRTLTICIVICSSNENRFDIHSIHKSMFSGYPERLLEALTERDSIIKTSVGVKFVFGEIQKFSRLDDQADELNNTYTVNCILLQKSWTDYKL